VKERCLELEDREGMIDCRPVALKSSNHFRAGFQELPREIVTANPPGPTTLRVEIFPKRKKPGPLWPMDEEAQYQPREA
jgi:microcystin degradation protein MlrC